FVAPIGVGPVPPVVGAAAGPPLAPVVVPGPLAGAAGARTPPWFVPVVAVVLAASGDLITEQPGQTAQPASTPQRTEWPAASESAQAAETGQRPAAETGDEVLHHAQPHHALE